MKKMLAMLLAAVMLAAVLTGCEKNISNNAQQLSGTVQPADISIEDVALKGESSSPTDFAVRLFRECTDGEENTLISPVSVLFALAMTANGAKGETLAQMERTLGMSVSELNSYLHAYKEALPEGERYKLSIANSVWFTDDERFTVNSEFLQTNADYYGADVYRAPFDDTTLRDINTWVENKTDGMVKDILDKIPEDAVMYLVNALAFDAEWNKMYEEYQIRDGEFTAQDGSKRKVEMMHGSENRYLEDEGAKGFMKDYALGKYTFVALLPNEGTTVQEYISGLTGERLAAMLQNPQGATVYTTMPKFECEYDVEMTDVLMRMGMTDAFDGKTADFSGLGTSVRGNIFINRVIHKTYIAVDGRGTKAGAATVVEMTDGCAMLDPEEPKEVVLDRPFVYMIVDREAMLPLFVGAMMDVG